MVLPTVRYELSHGHGTEVRLAINAFRELSGPWPVWPTGGGSGSFIGAQHPEVFNDYPSTLPGI